MSSNMIKRVSFKLGRPYNAEVLNLDKPDTAQARARASYPWSDSSHRYPRKTGSQRVSEYSELTVDDSV